MDKFETEFRERFRSLESDIWTFVALQAYVSAIPAQSTLPASHPTPTIDGWHRSRAMSPMPRRASFATMRAICETQLQNLRERSNSDRRGNGLAEYPRAQNSSSVELHHQAVCPEAATQNEKLFLSGPSHRWRIVSPAVCPKMLRPRKRRMRRLTTVGGWERSSTARRPSKSSGRLITFCALWEQISTDYETLERNWVLPRAPWVAKGPLLEHTCVARHWGCANGASG
jgi:hypothetical protein